MVSSGDLAPGFTLPRLDGQPLTGPRPGEPMLLAFVETDCPTCVLALPYLDKVATALAGVEASVVCVSQDPEAATREMVAGLSVGMPVLLDVDLEISRRYGPEFVPTLYVIDRAGRVLAIETGFDKTRLNALAALLFQAAGRPTVEVAGPHDGAPARKPGCISRQLEPDVSGETVSPIARHGPRGARASTVELDDSVDPYEYCDEAGFADALPVVPPTRARVDRLLEASPLEPEVVVGLVPPNYGAATVEKIAANAVMAGCPPALMRVLVPLVRAACDERLNLHGIQATTHAATPLVLLNGPVRGELGFAAGSNVFSNVARANSTLGRALQLILLNVGGARPGEIDVSTLGNPGKFSYCIAENEEESPWEPFHVDRGFGHQESALTLFAAEPPRGVSEHQARRGRTILMTVARTLVTIWSSRACLGQEAIVVLCPEHVRTLARDGFTKRSARDFLFAHTGVPVRAYADPDGEGTAQASSYAEITVDGEPCYRKFETPEAIRIVVAGGTAGKFSAVIGGWRGSRMVTYPIETGEVPGRGARNV